MAKNTQLDVDEELAKLLKEQEDFLNNGEAPAASVKRSSNAQPPSELQEESKTTEKEVDDAPTDIPVVGKIVERDVGQVTRPEINVQPTTTGFPKVERRKKSLFGRKREQKQAKAPVQPPQQDDRDKDQKELDDINNDKLAQMSMEEIRQEQEELRQFLDPELLQKLMNKPRNKPTTTRLSVQKTTKVEKTTPNTGKDTEKSENEKNLADIRNESELFAQSKFLPPEERAKHEWMTPLPPTVPSETNATRYDFDGNIIDAADGNIQSGLYHHGDDPDRAGYSLNELLHLARSTVPSQQALAFQTLSRIFTNRNLTDVSKEVTVTLRVGLDSSNHSVLSSAASALHKYIVPSDLASTICNTGQETDLVQETLVGNVLLPTLQQYHGSQEGSPFETLAADPVVADVVLNEDKEDNEGEESAHANREKIMTQDPVQAFVSDMDLLPRLRYLLSVMKLPSTTALHLLDILIVCAQHSYRNCELIVSDRALVEYIQKDCIGNEETWTSDAEADVTAKALKAMVLVRILSASHRNIATKLVSSGVIQSTKSFLAIADNSIKQKLWTLRVESLRIWRNLLLYALDFHCFSYIYPMLTSIDVTHEKHVTCALFAALSTFAGLEHKHEAQHYFSQLSLFIQKAAEVVSRTSDVSSCATALRFLTTCSNLVDKYHLDKTLFVQTYETIQKRMFMQHMLHEQNQVWSRECLVACLSFHHSLTSHGIVDDEEDNFFTLVTTHESRVLELMKTSLNQVKVLTPELSSGAHQFFIRISQTALLALHLSSRGSDAFASQLYALTLHLLPLLPPGSESLVLSLFSQVLFHSKMLLKTSIFTSAEQLSSVSNVLPSIYASLLSPSPTSEAHSSGIFSNAFNPMQRQSLNLRLPPLDENATVSNLPLPASWIYAPLSRVQSVGQSDDKQVQELQLILGGTCRYLEQLETCGNAVVQVDLSPIEKTFHLLFALFNSSDVLFDSGVQVPLIELIDTLGGRVLVDDQRKQLVTTLGSHLRHRKQLDPDTDVDTAAITKTSDTDVLSQFVESLMQEFVESSFGHPAFAKCISLFLLPEMPSEVVKIVWRMAMEARLLHQIQPMASHSASVWTSGQKRQDTELLWMMQKALVGPTTRDDSLATRMAIPTLQKYLFQEQTMSADRTMLFRSLLKSSRSILEQLLSHENARKILETIDLSEEENAKISASSS